MSSAATLTPVNTQYGRDEILDVAELMIQHPKHQNTKPIDAL
jgi:hypothetical protein